MLSVLIVEDNADVRRMIKDLIEDLASVIHECSDGAEALAAYTACHPDLVFMDIVMKEVDGITATRQITTANPGARIVIVTNHDDPELRNAAERAGAWGYVLKENLLEVRRLFQTETD
jgi:CheY-like chemotaxis protein